MKTGNTSKGSRNQKIGTLELGSRGNMIVNLTRFGGSLLAASGKPKTSGKRWPAGRSKGTSGRRSPKRATSSSSMEASH